MCHQVYVKSKISEIVGDTVDFLPRHTKIPFTSSFDYASLSDIADLIEALLYSNPEAPLAQLG